MGSVDTVTWQALTLLLTGVGSVATVLLWRARGLVTGLRALAVTVMVPAAYLTGTFRLLWEIADAVVGWAVRLAFSPTVWLGVALAVVAGSLLATASFVGRRAAGRQDKAPGGRPGRRLRPARAAENPDAVTSGTGTTAQRPARRAAQVDDDMADIEAILRRHGIS